MTVAYDTATEAVRIDTSDPMTWTHTPVGTPRGVVVAVVHGVSSTDHVVGVTYGGVAMTRVVRATDTATEPGAAELWFLGSGVPTGAQTVSADLASATTDDIHGISWTLTGAANLEVIDSDSISENAADPTRTLQAGGRTKISIAAMYGGGAAPGGTLAAGNTLSHTHDLGAFYSQSCYETTVDNADHTIGWSTLATDDLAFVAIAVSEVLPPDTALAGSSAGGSSASGVLTTAIRPAGSSIGGSTAAGVLTTAITLAGVSAASATAAASLTTQIALAGSSAGSSSASGTMGSGDTALAGSSIGGSTSAGALTTAIALAGATGGGSSAAALLATAIALRGEAQGSSTAGGTLATVAADTALAGSAIGGSSASGRLFAFAWRTFGPQRRAGTHSVRAPVRHLRE